jgi:hypothetical protein
VTVKFWSFVGNVTVPRAIIGAPLSEHSKERSQLVCCPPSVRVPDPAEKSTKEILGFSEEPGVKKPPRQRGQAAPPVALRLTPGPSNVELESVKAPLKNRSMLVCTVNVVTPCAHAGSGNRTNSVIRLFILEPHVRMSSVSMFVLPSLSM